MILALAVACITLLALFGLFRVVELIVEGLARTAGADDPPRIAFASAAIAVILIVVLFGGILATWRRRAFGASYWATLSSEGVAPEDIERMKREMGDVDFARAMADIDPDATPLERVIAIGQSVAAGEVTLDVIAVELRLSGGRITFVIHDPEAGRNEMGLRDAVRSLQGPEEMDIPMPLHGVIRLEDDAGTRYMVLPFGSGGGGGGTWRVEHQFTPAPPAAARRLSIIVDRLTDAPHPSFPRRRRPPRIIEGPFRFEVDLSRT